MVLQTAGRVRALLAAALVAAMLLVAAPAQAAVRTVEIGPDPTQQSIEAARGPFSVSEDRVSNYSVRGFGGGTIYYPSGQQGTEFGAVAVAPGYTASQSSMAWLGPRIASQGFVVFTIDTNSRYDQPSSRGDQLLAALDYLTDRSDVAGIVDPDRLSVMGHSMGGGGTFAAAKDDTSLKAAVALTPWNTDKRFPEVSTPTLVIGAESDTVASPTRHAVPLYEGLPDATPKAYLELRGASHFAPNRSNTTIAAQSIAWLKRYVDDDVRYDRFICPGPSTGIALSDARTNCAA
ncbi:alpha/beta hydrolase family protein [Microbacterium karelineae]|uniref:alpha/beta hydrolase family protein n=1 Tax=Microbacterium karelineae TaxID=2654283 RepID=UPI0012EA7A06|nr:dienelactone hydrolase family protein [Microbacterium karelineae]